MLILYEHVSKIHNYVCIFHRMPLVLVALSVRLHIVSLSPNLARVRLVSDITYSRCLNAFPTTIVDHHISTAE